jgi:broad specificity phosphatase PhoE
MGEAALSVACALRAGPTIYFVRHGETDWNAEARYQGQADIPLNDKGRMQAHRNGAVLRFLLPQIAEADFVASPLERARESMAIVRDALGLEPSAFRIDDRLKEAHYGRWQGTLAADLPEIDAEGLSARRRDPYRWCPPGGESYEALMDRIVPWLAEIERDTGVVSHGGVSRVLRGNILGIALATVPLLEVPQDRVLILRRDSVEWL